MQDKLTIRYDGAYILQRFNPLHIGERQCRSQVSIRKPSKVSLAQGRLEEAVAYLERLVNLKSSSVNVLSQTAKIDALQNEIKHLKKEKF